MLLVVYARIYGQAFANALMAIGRNLWTLILPIALLEAFDALGLLVSPMGFAGGFLMGLARSAALSIYTYFVAQVVAKQRVGLSELKTSIGAYFWTWINVFFGLWIMSLLLGPMTVTPDGQRMLKALWLLLLVALNAAPETIYLKGTSGFIETVQRSFRFLQENWIEWFIPNAIILAGWWFTENGTIPLYQLPPLLAAVVLGMLLHIAVVFRGFLYEILDGTTHRQRMFKFKGKL